MDENRRGMLGDPEVLESIREMEKATGNKVRVLEKPDGSIALDFTTPGNKDVVRVPTGPSRRERRAKRRRKP